MGTELKCHAVTKAFTSSQLVYPPWVFSRIVRLRLGSPISYFHLYVEIGNQVGGCGDRWGKHGLLSGPLLPGHHDIIGRVFSLKSKIFTDTKSDGVQDVEQGGADRNRNSHGIGWLGGWEVHTAKNVV